MNESISAAEALAEARAQHDEQMAEHRAAVADHDKAKTDTAALPGRHARGEAVSPGQLEQAEHAEERAGRAVKLAAARLDTTRQAMEQAEIADLRHKAGLLRAGYNAAADRLIAIDARIDAAITGARAGLAERDGVILDLHRARQAAVMFEAEIETRARQNAALAAIQPGERPRCGVPANVAPERILKASLIGQGFGEQVPVAFASLAAKDASGLGRPVPTKANP